MTPTRSHDSVGPQIDTGIGSPVAERPEIWAPLPATSYDTGTAEPQAGRPDLFEGGAGGYSVPPKWL